MPRYYVLLPALFFHSLATTQLGDLPVQAMPLVVLATTPLL
nr:hypothetical protein [uncultured Pseudomonas sp.]